MSLLSQSQRSYYEGPDGIQNSGDENYGNYQFISLRDLIDTFIFVYVGEEKLIKKVRRTDVVFHAKRAMQELSFDTFKSTKSFEYTVPSTLTMPVPYDYVNYIKLCRIDSAGIKQILYPALKTSNPLAYQQNDDGTFKFETNTFSRNGNDFEQYGITSSGLTSPAAGAGDFKSEELLPKFEKETRISINNASGHNNQELVYGPARGMRIDFFTANHDITVGMTIFGPGIPDGSVVTSVGDSTNTNFPGMGITFTNPANEQYLLDPQGTNLGLPELNSTVVSVASEEEVIFVDLNKKSKTWENYKSQTANDNIDKYDDGTYDLVQGERYGIDPQNAQVNGSFYIDQNTGLIHFSSGISGQCVVLDYISDSLGTDDEMKVHKLAEEAMYRYIAHAVLAGKANIPEYIVNRFKREKFAAIRQAKLRLSNIKLEEITQVLRGKSKWIKH